MEFVLKKRPDGLIEPGNEFAEEKLAKIKAGTLFKGEYVGTRNYGNLQRYHVFIGKLWDNMDDEMKLRFKNDERFRKALEWISGNREIIPRKNGDDVQIVGSVSYESVPSEAEFKELFSKLIDAALEYFPTWTRADMIGIIEQEIIHFI